MEKTNCILCDGDDTKILVAIPGIVTGSCGGCNLVQCEHCSLVYVNPRPTLEELWSYYDEKYKTHLDDYAAISDQERNEDNYYLGRVKLLLNQLSTGFDSGRLLDVGCGDGYWLYLMQKRG